MKNALWSLIKRTVWSLTLLIGVVVGSFLLFNVAPGDPARIMLGPNASVESVEQLRSELGLNRPLWEQCNKYVKQVLTFNLGRSIIDNRSVAKEVLDKFAVTARVGALAAIIALIISYIINLIVFIYPRARPLITLVTLGVVVPTFFTGVMAALALGVWFPIVPLTGYGNADASGIALLLPAVIVAFYPIALMTLVLHKKIAAATATDYARAAAAFGFSKWHMFHRVLLRPVAVSWLTTLINQLSVIFISSFILEVIFTIPGVGSLLVRTIQSKDLTMLQGILLVNAFFFVALFWLSDVILSLLDPRMRVDVAS